jgi:hypothetical protein
MWWLVLFSSVALTCTGIWLLVRDNAAAFIVPKPAKSETTTNIAPLPETVAARVPTTAGAALWAAEQTKPTAAIRPVSMPAGASAMPLTPQPSPTRLPAVEAHWIRLRSEIEMSVQAVNVSMLPLAVVIAKPGEPSWSLHDCGFGDYRRVRVGGESIAWLRMELAADMSIAAHLRTHEPRHDMLNRSSTIGRPLIASRIGPALAECLAALAAASPRLMPMDATVAVVAPAGPRDTAAAAQTAPLAAPLAADTSVQPPPRTRGTVWPQWLSRPTPIEPTEAARHVAPPPPAARTRTLTGTSAAGARLRREPAAAAALIDTAVTLVNSAFEETGARLVPATQTVRQEPVGPDSRALSINVAGTSVGLMLIAPVSGRIDIAVGVSNLANFEAARRHSHQLAGLTVHPLAEAIATCAWPAIAAAKSAS